MGNYLDYATTCLNKLLAWYNKDTGLWDTTGFWNAANSFEALADYSILLSTQQLVPVFTNTFEKLKGTNFSRPFNDDEGWWALALIKAFDHTNNSNFLAMAQTIFDDMAKSWDEGTCGGGLWWKKDKGYKNAITNELFLMIAARLYLRTVDERYLQWARKEMQWFFSSGLLNEQSLVNDGLDGNCKNNGGTTWTYNQGVIIGALVDLAKCASYDAGSALLGSNGEKFLVQAQQIADAAITTLVDQHGILREPCEEHGNCNEDQTQFKGVFMRNLAYLYLALNALAEPPASNVRYKQFILTNVESLWANGRAEDGTFGTRWGGPFDSADASRQTSALDCFNAALPFDHETEPVVEDGNAGAHL